MLQLRNEMTRTEAVNNNLQGYGLDSLGDQELTSLVNQMNQVDLKNLVFINELSKLVDISSQSGHSSDYVSARTYQGNTFDKETLERNSH